jgi:RIP metalloprotease RseP
MTQTIEPPRSEIDVGHDDPADPASNSLFRVGVLVLAVAALGVIVSWTVVFVIAAIMISILLHEFGHFLAARRTGMKAPEFFAGFGPKLWSFRRGETEYGLKAVLVGGYVKIIGMNNLEEVDPADEARTFRQQTYPKRVLVAFAGPAMNLILAFVLLLVVVMGWGFPRDAAWPQVTPVDGGAAAAAGMEAGDRIVSFDGQPMPTDFSTEAPEAEDFVSLVQSRAGETVEIEVERDGEIVPLTVDVGLMIAGMTGLEWPEVSSVRPGTPAAAIGLQPGDEIVEVGGSAAPESYQTFVDDIIAAQGTSVDLVVEREDELYSATLDVPDAVEPDGFLGVTPYRPPSEPERNPVVAAREAGARGGEFVWLSIYGLGRFFSPAGLSNFAERVVTTPPVEEDEPSGTPASQAQSEAEPSEHPPLPIEPNVLEEEGDRVQSVLGIITIGSQLGAADQILVLIALLNVFLAIFNLVPLLPFDGGHIAVATYERIREALDKRKLVAARLVGSRYFADYAKLLPLTYVVVALIVMVGMGALYLDAVDPIDIGN